MLLKKLQDPDSYLKSVIPDISLNDYFSFFLGKDSTRLTEDVNQEIYDSLANSGYYQLNALNITSVIFGVVLILLSFFNTTQDNYVILKIHAPLILMAVGILLFLNYNRSNGSYNYQKYRLAILPIALYAGFAWAYTAHVLAIAAGLPNELGLAVLSAACIIVAISMTGIPHRLRHLALNRPHNPTDYVIWSGRFYFSLYSFFRVCALFIRSMCGTRHYAD